MQLENRRKKLEERPARGGRGGAQRGVRGRGGRGRGGRDAEQSYREKDQPQAKAEEGEQSLASLSDPEQKLGLILQIISGFIKQKLDSKQLKG